MFVPSKCPTQKRSCAAAHRLHAQSSGSESRCGWKVYQLDSGRCIRVYTFQAHIRIHYLMIVYAAGELLHKTFFEWDTVRAQTSLFLSWIKAGTKAYTALWGIYATGSMRLPQQRSIP